MRFDANKQIWFPMEIRGVSGYFADIRINRDTVPGWFRFWELADGDSDGEPCRYRNGIAVNFYGTFLTVGELPIDDREWAEGYIVDGEWEIAWDRPLPFDAIIQIESGREAE